MISKIDENAIIECARKYKVREIILFGSCVDSETANDIDIGIKGIQPELFFKFYGELMRKLSKDVDVVDLSDKCLFNELVVKRGIEIYG
ncbi:MAG: hypothetical protein COZ15_05000 [Elusimicrobia bacterium CG_4_10_14_3_um_filter_49_12_50_7]|nr:MAG: hypothetical protein COZ15_05000 [Elusimicrobia bacterium CG_4_10_14_3_um_filter_49_12_50_7]